MNNKTQFATFIHTLCENNELIKNAILEGFALCESLASAPGKFIISKLEDPWIQANVARIGEETFTTQQGDKKDEPQETSKLLLHMKDNAVDIDADYIDNLISSRNWFVKRMYDNTIELQPLFPRINKNKITTLHHICHADVLNNIMKRGIMVNHNSDGRLWCTSPEVSSLGGEDGYLRCLATALYHQMMYRHLRGTKVNDAQNQLHAVYLIEVNIPPSTKDRQIKCELRREPSYEYGVISTNNIPPQWLTVMAKFIPENGIQVEMYHNSKYLSRDEYQKIYNYIIEYSEIQRDIYGNKQEH